METPVINPGARPANEATETAAAANVQSLFNAIAPTYDPLNHLLSMGLDRRWWRRSAQAFRGILQHPEACVLDLCCGTGDMTAALLELRPQIPSAQPVIGLDFSPEMLNRARIKFPTPNVEWVEGDAMHLPYPDNSFDLITSAFGFRNLANYAAALAEIHRVLRPNGRIGILECNQPDGLSGVGYNLYLHYGLPFIGGLLSGERAAYAYLPASIARFPRPPQMLALLRKAGFTDEAWTGYLFKAAGLYQASKDGGNAVRSGTTLTF
jgi:demethylmenaquinone methyltransferase/2-methoxy-6-polyprenyl-1,4-benzoquinol methylase